MNFKKFFAAAAACAVAAFSAASFAANTVSAQEGFPTKAFLAGMVGATQIWSTDEVTDGSTVADINGDAQYQVEWKVADGGTDQMQFLMVWIPFVTKDQYPGLTAKIDAVYVDGNQISNYTMSSNAVDTAYYEAGKDPGTRLYLIDTWTGNKIEDLPKTTAITQSIKVVFTISGTGIAGTSNVTDTTTPSGDNTTPTQAPSDNNNNNQNATQAPANNNNNNTQTQAQQQNNNTNNSTNSGSTSGGAVLGNSTQTNSASTGDAGVAAAVAGLVITAGIGAAAVAMKSRKK